MSVAFHDHVSMLQCNIYFCCKLTQRLMKLIAGLVCVQDTMRTVITLCFIFWKHSLSQIIGKRSWLEVYWHLGDHILSSQWETKTRCCHATGSHGSLSAGVENTREAERRLWNCAMSASTHCDNELGNESKCKCCSVSLLHTVSRRFTLPLAALLARWLRWKVGELQIKKQHIDDWWHTKHMEPHPYACGSRLIEE